MATELPLCDRKCVHMLPPTLFLRINRQVSLKRSGWALALPTATSGSFSMRVRSWVFTCLETNIKTKLCRSLSMGNILTFVNCESFSYSGFSYLRLRSFILFI